MSANNIVTNSEARDGYPAGVIKWILNDAGELRWVTGTEGIGRAIGTGGVGLTNDQLDDLDAPSPT